MPPLQFPISFKNCIMWWKVKKVRLAKNLDNPIKVVSKLEKKKQRPTKDRIVVGLPRIKEKKVSNFQLFDFLTIENKKDSLKNVDHFAGIPSPQKMPSFCSKGCLFVFMISRLSMLETSLVLARKTWTWPNGVNQSEDSFKNPDWRFTGALGKVF